jgi:hypothetical protein
MSPAIANFLRSSPGLDWKKGLTCDCGWHIGVKEMSVRPSPSITLPGQPHSLLAWTGQDVLLCASGGGTQGVHTDLGLPVYGTFLSDPESACTHRIQEQAAESLILQSTDRARPQTRSLHRDLSLP